MSQPNATCGVNLHVKRTFVLDLFSEFLLDLGLDPPLLGEQQISPCNGQH